MANETKKELSGFALWARKRAIKNAALKETKERYKQEELARKNKLKELKATDKEAYKEAVKKEKEESALRKLGLSASLKRAERDLPSSTSVSTSIPTLCLTELAPTPSTHSLRCRI